MQESKKISISPELMEIINEIIEGYEKGLDIKISIRQATYILAKKLKKAKIEFVIP
jgi:hypothetical protein